MEALVGALLVVTGGVIAGMFYLCVKLAKVQAGHAHLMAAMTVLAQNDQGIARVLLQQQTILSTKVLLKDDSDEGYLERMN